MFQVAIINYKHKKINEIYIKNCYLKILSNKYLRGLNVFNIK